jgi:hypothetical protein
MFSLLSSIDALLNSSMDSTVSPKVKIVEGEGVGAHSLGHAPWLATFQR